MADFEMPIEKKQQQRHKFICQSEVIVVHVRNDSAATKRKVHWLKMAKIHTMTKNIAHFVFASVSKVNEKH